MNLPDTPGSHKLQDAARLLEAEGYDPIAFMRWLATHLEAARYAQNKHLHNQHPAPHIDPDSPAAKRIKQEFDSQLKKTEDPKNAPSNVVQINDFRKKGN